MVKKKILPWLSVSALIFALPVNAAENNTFMANTPDMYTAEKYIEKREKKYEVMFGNISVRNCGRNVC